MSAQYQVSHTELSLIMMVQSTNVDAGLSSAGYCSLTIMLPSIILALRSPLVSQVHMVRRVVHLDVGMDHLAATYIFIVLPGLVAALIEKFGELGHEPRRAGSRQRRTCGLLRGEGEFSELEPQAVSSRRLTTAAPSSAVALREFTTLPGYSANRSAVRVTCAARRVLKCVAG